MTTSISCQIPHMNNHRPCRRQSIHIVNMYMKAPMHSFILDLSSSSCSSYSSLLLLLLLTLPRRQTVFHATSRIPTPLAFQRPLSPQQVLLLL
ncbi:hypothetical protein CERZMDRAFT_91562 [Cercospora zeae-maydis SCOH1-5]|uniref:Uncharacterized protein n=1 Tax=Cercospora zeae-maydis SCOH1-5 TaxID=717836 RepID=A0A6A6F7U1_9PEZI|nr:hypothetical protein CERZMDRAFT_91562 [Cercospora zeae-maydis SCOH1-5]